MLTQLDFYYHLSVKTIVINQSDTLYIILDCFNSHFAYALSCPVLI